MSPKHEEPGPATMVRAIRDGLMVGVLAVSLLYFGAGFLIPLALAFFLYVLIIAVSNRFSALPLVGPYLPGWLTLALGIVVVMAGMFAVMYVLADQATRFLLKLPGYGDRLEQILTRVAELVGSQIPDVIRDQLASLDVSLIAYSAFGGARSFLSTFLLISLYVIFMLAERGVIARKIELAATDPELSRELRRIMSDISLSLQRYVGVKTFISLLTAIVCYGVYRALNLEFAETWAVLTFALNFIPAIGSIIAVLLPALAALVQFDTLGPFLVVLLGTGIVQFSIGNFLDPALIGRSLNLSTLMVILALTFWAGIWGIIGAFLSVPLTVCLLIVFSNIPAARPIAILMSKEGTLMSGQSTRAPDDAARPETAPDHPGEDRKPTVSSVPPRT
ncbi:AI-2E family transporter [Pontibaca methylaminivorans]|uniref:Predicted PurR-regulated permease PerM n=1 Tax=Pontibaca methylaminivorans TaxID=515897 RepID=A0A1R3WIW6_9RHOB|nr:AI-2E family transporter [Pontibaca methylaminivorans]SIT78030.1 Predicted PurR-regulated permease PerM [Pontibaca methylaminivorans]